MKLIIAGGRDYQFTDADYDSLDELLSSLPIQEVVSGGATGADECGEAWAKLRGVPVKVFRANWKTWGSAAGPIRNREMAKYADAVALFPGGRGTKSMHQEAEDARIDIYDFRR